MAGAANNRSLSKPPRCSASEDVLRVLGFLRLIDRWKYGGQVVTCPGSKSGVAPIGRELTRRYKHSAYLQ